MLRAAYLLLSAPGSQRTVTARALSPTALQGRSAAPALGQVLHDLVHARGPHRVARHPGNSFPMRTLRSSLVKQPVGPDAWLPWRAPSGP